MTMYPTPSQAFSQRDWPEVGDIDDCWVIATIQAMNAVAPWLDLPTNTEFRRAAGDPDDGISDGGNMDEIMKACRALWPQLRVRDSRGWTWDQWLTTIKAGHVASVCIDAGKLPSSLQYGFNKLHQLTVWHEPTIGLWHTNPLMKDRAKPVRMPTAVMQAAAFGYAGSNRVSSAVFPTIDEAFTTHPLYKRPDPGQATQEQIDAAVKAATDAANTTIQRLNEAIASMRTIDREVGDILRAQAQRIAPVANKI